MTPTSARRSSPNPTSKIFTSGSPMSSTAIFPDEWKESSDDADFDLVEISLDQLVAAVSAGQKNQAEQARLTAYAFFEFGPELKLNAFDPQLVAEIEGLFWYGARGVPGLAGLISSGAPASEVRETTLVLEEALAEARDKTGEGVSDGTAITNASLIVFREGLEAILIIAAITASMLGARAALQKADLQGCPARPPGQRARVRAGCGAARFPRRLRGETRSDRGRGGDRGPCGGAQLVLPPGLLDRVDRHPPQARQGADRRRRARGRRRHRHDRRSVRARLHLGVPRRHGDRAVPPGAPAFFRGRRGRGRGRARADRHGDRRLHHLQGSNASCPTRRC